MFSRRLSIASSISEGASFLLTEEDLFGLSDDQLAEANEEVKRSCVDLQVELSLFNRYLRSQKPNIEEATLLVPTPSQISSQGDSPSTSTLGSVKEERIFNFPDVSSSTAPKRRLEEREKCWLFQNELDNVREAKKRVTSEYHQDLLTLKVRQKVAEASKEDCQKAMEQLSALVKAKPFPKRQSHKSVSLQQIASFLRNLNQSWQLKGCDLCRKTVMLVDQMKTSRRLIIFNSTPIATKVDLMTSEARVVHLRQIVACNHQLLRHNKLKFESQRKAYEDEKKNVKELHLNIIQLQSKIGRVIKQTNSLRQASLRLDNVLQSYLKCRAKTASLRAGKTKVPSVGDILCQVDPRIATIAKRIQRRTSANIEHSVHGGLINLE